MSGVNNRLIHFTVGLRVKNTTRTKPVNAPVRTLSLDLKEHAKSYDFDASKFTAINNHIIESILDYHPEYGRYLAHHLIRFGKNLSGFMNHLGEHDADIIQKVSMAGKIHDCGKIRQDVEVHLTTPEKPSQDIRELRKLHPYLAADVIEKSIRATGSRLGNDDWRHVETMIYIAENHHERLDGSGPSRLTAERMDDILRMITIVDEVDGKIKVEGKKDLTIIFGEICGAKHDGMFDLRLSREYDCFCNKEGLYRDISAILNAPYPRTA